jgi:biotin synthase-like enzyme
LYFLHRLPIGTFLPIDGTSFAKKYRVTIERISLSKQTYTVKYPRKVFPFCDILRGVDACARLSG